MSRYKVLITVIFVTISFGAYGQFLKPVPKNLFSEVTVDSKAKGNSIWMMRPAITVTAVQWNYKDGAFSANAFQSAGFGAGWQHFRPVSSTDLTPYNDWGVNGMILLGTDISAAVTVSGLGIINLGVLYNFTQKAPGILTGVQIRF
jgi:hypothetical protein